MPCTAPISAKALNRAYYDYQCIAPSLAECSTLPGEMWFRNALRAVRFANLAAYCMCYGRGAYGVEALQAGTGRLPALRGGRPRPVGRATKAEFCKTITEFLDACQSEEGVDFLPACFRWGLERIRTTILMGLAKKCC